MFKRFFAFVLIFAGSVAVHAQGTHRISQVVSRAATGVDAQIVPYAHVLVCQAGTGCSSLATIYSNIALTGLPAANPVVADAGGNYDYYVTLGCYDEQISAPGMTTFTIFNVCNGVGGVTQILAGNNITISPTNGIGQVTINATGGGGSSGFDEITSGTNTTATMLVGSGANLSPTGSGIIGATSIGGITVTGTPSTGQVLTATSTTAANWQASGLTGAVLLNPSGTQIIVQPASTYLNSNNFNATYQADQYGNKTSNGISTVTGLSTACLTQNATGPSGCTVKVSPNYPNTEFPQGYEMPSFQLRNFTWPSGVLVEDNRNGVRQLAAENPMSNNPESGAAQQILVGVTRNWLQQQPFPEASVPGTQVNWESIFTGGTNYENYPTGSPRYEYKPYYINVNDVLNQWSSGQQFGHQILVNCHGVGDCIGEVGRIVADGGTNTADDEGGHWADISILQNPDVYTGTITGTVTTGSTSIGTSATIGAGTQGQDRLLVDTASGKTITGPSFTNPTTRLFVGPIGPTALLPYTATDATASYPVSTMILACYPGSDNGAGGASACSSGTQPSGYIPANNTTATGLSPNPSIVVDVVAPFSATGGYAGIPSGFCDSTNLQSSDSGAACYMPASGVVMIDDSNSEYETVNYTYNSGTQTITLSNLRFPHNNGFIISYGGLAGYAVASNADNYQGPGFFGFNGQVFPVIGSVSATTIYYETQNTIGPLGVSQDQNGGPANGGLCFSTSASGFTLQPDNHTVLFTMAEPSGTNNTFPEYNGLTLTITTGNSDYNGNFVVQWGTAGTQQFTYVLPTTPTGGAPSSGTVSFCNTSYSIWPSARVLSAYDSSNSQVDGVLTVSPNNMPWATGDPMFEAQYWNLNLTGTGGADIVTQVSPRNFGGTPLNGQDYEGLVSGVGWTLLQQKNGTASSQYLGYGGTHTVPTAIYGASGHSAYTLTLDPPENSILETNGCKAAPIGCSNANSNFNIWQGPILPNQVSGINGIDLINYDPAYEAANRAQGLFSGKYLLGNIIGPGQGNQGPSFATFEAGYLQGDVNITTPSITADNIFTKQLTTINGSLQATCTGTCATTYHYWLVGHALSSLTGHDAVTLPVDFATVSNAASLDSSHFNLICAFFNPGYASYDILRGDTAHSVTLALSATNPNGASFGVVGNYSCFKDAGGSLSAYVPPSVNTTGGATFVGPFTAFSLQASGINAAGVALFDASGNLTSSTALPNGTTATTQSPGDNTTKVATDAFVLANAGAGVGSINGSPGAFTFTGSGVSCTGTTCTFSGAGSGIGSITWAIPSWLAASPGTISASGTQTFSAATGQTSHQVIGTCGTGTSFAPCSLVSGDLPVGTTSLPGAVSVDNVTIKVSGGGQISLISSGNSTIAGFDTSGNYIGYTASTGISIASGLITNTAPMTYPSGTGIPTVSGGAWTSTVAAPTGTIVGTTDTQTLTNKTVDGVTPTTFGFLDATSSIQTQLNAKAPLASPAFTGTPTAPTASSGTNTTQIATTAFVKTAIGVQVADVTITFPALTIPANTCWGPSGTTTPGTITMSGLTTSNGVIPMDSGNPSAVTGWGAVGGLNIRAWASGTNIASYVVCNNTASSISGSSIGFILGAK